MKPRGISQEGLKLIACVTMLLDHVAATLMIYGWPCVVMRGIGRIAFPIYCFLIAEGAHYTKNPGKYALRLLIGAALSEIPFDLALFGSLSWQHQSVMVTMLLGFCALWVMGRSGNLLLKCLVGLSCILLGDLLRTDYGSYGVLLILLLGLFREKPMGKLLQSIAIVLLCTLIPSAEVQIGVLRFPLEMIGCLSVFPILLYFGRKRTNSKAVQWAFYLFYPAHLAVLAFLR